MKKLFVITSLFIVLYLPIYAGLPNTTEAVYDLEANTNDSYHDYDLTRDYCPEIDLYSNTRVFHGSYSYYPRKDGECSSCGQCLEKFWLRAPNSLITTLANASKWTICVYMYISDRDGVGRFNGDALLMVDDDGSDGGNNLNILVFTDTSGCGDNSVVMFRFGGYSCGGDYTPYYDSWARWNIEWDGSTYKLYINGTLKISYSNSTNVFSTATDFKFGRDFFRGNYGWIDRIIIVRDVFNGGEIKAKGGPQTNSAFEY